MFRRPVVLVLAAVIAAATVSSALGASVHVRIEGKTRTLFGPTEPVVPASNALEALEAASAAGEFYYHVSQTSFGAYVDQIGRFAAAGQTGWVFKVNNVSPPVGADAVTLKDGDRVLWYWAQFGVAGGPRTLELRRASHVNCYRVLAHDDSGAATPAGGAVLRVDGRTRATKGGTGCVGRHRGLVRATLAGAVRSNALR